MDKNLKKNMKALFDLIIDEAEKNEEFASSLSKIFCGDTTVTKAKESSIGKRASNRRDKAVVAPIKLAEDGELSEDVLSPLSEKELKDIIANYGMAPSKLAMKWKDKD